MTKQTAIINWNGKILHISAAPDSVLSRLAGEEVINLKVTDQTSVNPLINNTYAASLIQSAGGAVDFVDVMLSAQAA